jgi:hypothetical protein
MAVSEFLVANYLKYLKYSYAMAVSEFLVASFLCYGIHSYQLILLRWYAPCFCIFPMLWHLIISVNLITLMCTLFQVQTACSAGCVCDQTPNWKTEELTLSCLKNVRVSRWGATDHEAALVKRLLKWATVLETMRITFDRSVAESKAREFCQMLQSFSRPEVCMKGKHFAWSSCTVAHSTTLHVREDWPLAGDRFVVLICLIWVSTAMSECQDQVHPSVM